MKCWTAAAAAAVVCAISAPSARAHPPPFWWMTDMSETNRAGVELSLGNPELGPVDTTTIAGSLFAEFAVNRALTVHGRLPLAIVSFDPNLGGEDSETALGNLSVGLQATSRRRTGGRAITLVGGGFAVHLPTGSEGAAAGGAAAAAGQLSVPDPGRWLMDTTTFRLRGNARVESGSLFFQAEVDLDIFLRDGDDDIDVMTGFGPGIAVTRELAFLVELSIANITDDELFNLDAGLRYHTRALMLGARLYLPLSDPLRDAGVVAGGVDIAARF